MSSETLSAVRWAARAALAALAGCGAGGGGGGGGGPGYGGVPKIDVTAGQKVGHMEVVAPAADEFLLHGTLPLPPGIFPRPDGKVPLVVVDYDGSPVLTQLESVTRYADAGADGADVVEVLARVHRDPALVAGTRVAYDVTFVDAAGTDQPTGPVHPDALAEGPFTLPGEVLDLLAAGLSVRTFDCFGNDYAAELLDPAANVRLLKYGPMSAQVASFQPMLPTPPVAGSTGTLAHLFGVHAYASTFAGEPFVALDLRFSNGFDNHDKLDPDDDALAKFYFETLELLIPNGWIAVLDAEDPALGNAYSAGGNTIYPIVAPNGDGTLHVMPKWGQFHRRFVLAPIFAQDRAQAWSQREGLAFCRDMVDVASGEPCFSWWNKGTARYFPQRHRLPSLDHVGLDNLRSQLAGTHAWLENAIESGQGDGIYPLVADALGWSHPWGVSYGGMTSGNEIFMYEGVDVAAAASVEGYRALELTHRMQTERQPNALWSLSGQPTRVEDWLVENGNADYVDCFFYMTLTGSTDPFGFNAAPTFQNDFVASSGLVPAYEAEFLSYEPHDLQHLIRYTRSPKTLAWLGNDALSKDDLLAQTELFHLSYHPYFNSAYGHVQSTGLLIDQQYVAAHPHNAFPYGRGEAWGLDTAVAAYALAADDWRAQKLAWLQQIAEVVSDGQVSCSGFIQGEIGSKFLDGKYRCGQMIEQSIIEHALWGLRESVLRGVDPAHDAMIEDVLVDSVDAMISEMGWGSGQIGPWQYRGIAPLDENDPAWCDFQPPDGHTAELDTYQEWCSFAYGYELSGDQVLLDKAQVMAGGAPLMSALEWEGVDQIQVRAALVALMQELTYGLP